MKQRPTEPSLAQLDTLAFIIKFIEEHGYQPSCTEIGSHFEIVPAAALGRLLRLQSHGLLHLCGSSRAIRLPGYRFIAVVVPEGTGAHHEQTA